jgi:hypothetical protein
MERSDIENIARVVLRDYALPLKLDGVRVDGGRCTIDFADPYCAGARVNVGVWCDAKTSAYGVRELLKKQLHVTD